MLLGEVARHAGAGERAERAFRVLRERFQGTAEASFAAFALGRLQFDAYGSYASAARWFRVYLKEQPGGSFAREALGRLMEATSRAQNHSEAQRLARRYLQVYPAGPHAELASRIAQSP
jgi:TolA-binding protein